ncbi:hypothetical protein GCM10011344_20350 [Dokdonia pacifica]|uniref:Uncharacterized protein n=1 Tax=Dokdonia pacifica TaxID=1627892 RepID=A0A238VN91_9FLAO|nr:hypothetical protein [Dokdonia pacifica]GGG19582.1 hypothetical protein GCM10011344_20350 [Dokdonia pacifica]SNR35825.1 hypothetical protein SAMN06265376_10198 [Dokdonia pacifica]
MKTTFYLTMIMIIGVCAFAKAQTTPTKEKPKTNNNLPADGNLLDQQAQVLGNVFGDIGGVKEMQGITGYMDLLNKSDLSPELKQKFTEQYKIIALSDDPKKKKEMELKLSKMIEKALKEGQEKDNLKTKG